MTTSTEVSICASCAHFRHRLSSFQAVCPAFPNGIPNEILQGDVDHRSRHPDQVGDVVHTLGPDVDSVGALRLFEIQLWERAQGASGSFEESAADEGAGMLVADLTKEDDRRPLDEVLADIAEVLGSVENDEDVEDADEACCYGDELCDSCYDEESRSIAGMLVRERRLSGPIADWTVETFVTFRSEAHNADHHPLVDYDEWFDRHGLDEQEQLHIWGDCPSSCPLCCGDPRYEKRISQRMHKKL
jgi:hypothetical protein